MGADRGRHRHDRAQIDRPIEDAGVLGTHVLGAAAVDAAQDHGPARGVDEAGAFDVDRFERDRGACLGSQRGERQGKGEQSRRKESHVKPIICARP